MREEWPFWRRFLNLAQPRLGARVIAVSDDFFGAASRLIEPHEPQFILDKYDDHGKWMDGWESRRRRDDGHDWCVIELGAPARLFGVEIATSHFNGNQPETATLDVTVSQDTAAHTDFEWRQVLPSTALQPDAQHRLDFKEPQLATHLRLNIYPDGGVARLRAYGVVEQAWEQSYADRLGDLIDLAAVGNGGYVVAASDEHFGIASNLLLPGRGVNMGDGWETARRRGPGHDWCVVALGCQGQIEELEIDTAFFRGNFPHQCSVDACLATDNSSTLSTETAWTEVLPRTFMQADHQHRLRIDDRSTFSHVRLNMFPDGGVSRLRVLGRPIIR